MPLIIGPTSLKEETEASERRKIYSQLGFRASGGGPKSLYFPTTFNSWADLSS